MCCLYVVLIWLMISSSSDNYVVVGIPRATLIFLFINFTFFQRRWRTTTAGINFERPSATNPLRQNNTGGSDQPLADTNTR